MNNNNCHFSVIDMSKRCVNYFTSFILLNSGHNEVRDVPCISQGNPDSENFQPNSALGHLDKENILTTEVLLQSDGFLGNQYGHVLDLAVDKGPHVVSLQKDEHTAGHTVSVSTRVDAGLGL